MAKKSKTKLTIKKRSDLEDVFLDRTVTLSGGKRVTMRPLKLKHWPKLFGLLAKVWGADDIEDVDADFIMSAIEDKADDLLNAAMVDATTNDLPMSAAPKLLEVFIDQNFDQNTLGNWRSLMVKMAQKLSGMTEESTT